MKIKVKRQRPPSPPPPAPHAGNEEDLAERHPSYPALRISQNDQLFYFATIPVDDLFPYCFVSRRLDDPQQGFQRLLDSNRADAIAAYLAAGSGSIPTNIVLSAQSGANFKYRRKTKTVSFARVPKAFLVLDGQHRLWGYSRCRIKHRVPVSIYEGLRRADEAKLFIDINTTQRGVPAALLLDIKQLAEVETRLEKVLREYFNKLKDDPKSPLVGRLSSARSITGKISRVTFYKAVGPVLQGKLMIDSPEETRYPLLLNYLRAFDAELLDKGYLVRSAFFEAIMDVFDEVVRACITKSGKVQEDGLREVVRPLTQLDYSPRPGATKTTKTAISDAMKAALRMTIAISPEML